MWDMVRGGSAEGTARKGPFWSHKILVEIYRVYPIVQKKISQNSVWTLGGAVMRVRSSFLAVNTSHPTSTMNFISLKWSFWSALNAVKISKLATIGNKSNFQFTRAISPKIPRILVRFLEFFFWCRFFRSVLTHLAKKDSTRSFKVTRGHLEVKLVKFFEKNANFRTEFLTTRWHHTKILSISRS